VFVLGFVTIKENDESTVILCRTPCVENK
jgi:hypothetical protein